MAQEMSREMSARQRAKAFCDRYALQIPILQAPMAGACPASLAIAVAQAGGMGGMGGLMTSPDGIRAWASEVRASSNGAFQINLWVPPDYRVWKEAGAIGADIEVREPFDKPDPEKYGRLSSLEQINELAYLTLFKIAVSSAADAVRVLTPLLKRI